MNNVRFDYFLDLYISTERERKGDKEQLQHFLKQLWHTAPQVFVKDENWLPQAAIDAIRAGQKINAIKEYRAFTGSSLLDAKNAVEAWIAKNMPNYTPVYS